MPEKNESVKTLIVKYNKVIDETFDALIPGLKEITGAEVVVKNIRSFGDKTDILSYKEVSMFLEEVNPYEVLIGDVFWPTGQNICKWCKQKNTWHLQENYR